MPPKKPTSLKCELCDKSFTRKATLNYHIKTHKKEKAYKCELCGKNFALKSYLIQHFKVIHPEKKPIKCEQCTIQRPFWLQEDFDHHV